MAVSVEFKKTPVYNRHVALGAKMVDFHGWLMPLQYKGIIHEHLATRNNVGIFDVSHMGEIEIKGPDSYSFLQYLITNNLDKISPGRALYTHMCYENGGIVDDLIVYIFSKEHFILVVNASNSEKDFNWISKYSKDAKDVSSSTALISLQGPRACGILEKFLGESLSGLKCFHFQKFRDIIVSRTGYTGEDGFELFIDWDRGEWLWDELMKFKPEPVGLGARDTLRLEKGYPLYGNDIDETTTPLDAGLMWVVDLKKDFIGRDALLKHKPKRKLVRLEMQGQGIPRHGCAIFYEGKKVGTVTSGTYCPSLCKGIGMGYVDGDYKEVEIDIRGRLYNANTR